MAFTIRAPVMRAPLAGRSARASRPSAAPPSSARARVVASAAGEERDSGNAGQATAAVAAALSVVLLAAQPAYALNRFEESRFGEFDRGSAKQFGSMNQKGVDFVKEYGADLRLSNFTATEMRNSKLRGADVRGAYFIKAVAPDSDFTGTNFSDALMDRAVFVNANFTDAVLTRVVLTLSDLNGANVTNADFSDALLDRQQQEGLCKTASGTNPTTGVNTRKSLGCGGRPRGSPSLYMTDDTSKKPEALFDADRFSSFSTKE